MITIKYFAAKWYGMQCHLYGVYAIILWAH